MLSILFFCISIMISILFECIQSKDQINIVGGELAPSVTISQVDQEIRNYFGKQFFFYSHLPKTLTYDGGLLYRNNYHVGQRKLLLNEIQFLSAFTDVYPKNLELIIYIGAAPCEHLTYIQSLFPNKNFLLIDPNYIVTDATTVLVYQNHDVISKNALKIVDNYKKGSEVQRRAAKRLQSMPVLDFMTGEADKKHNIMPSSSPMAMETQKRNYHSNSDSLIPWILKSHNDVFVIQDYATIELAHRLFKSLQNAIKEFPKLKIFLISDIRTNLFHEFGPKDMDILFNDYLQMAFMHILKPNYTMIKFHPPYFDSSDKSISTYHSDSWNYPGIFPVLQFVSTTFGFDAIEMMQKKTYKHYEPTTIFLQPWANNGSSEARLIISKETIEQQKLQYYNSQEWDNAFGFVNYFRTYGWTSVNVYGSYDASNDCAIEIATFAYYLFRRSNNVPFSEDLFIEIFKNANMKDIQQMHDQLQKHLHWDICSHINCGKSSGRKKPSFVFPHYTNRYFYSATQSEVVGPAHLKKLQLFDTPMSNFADSKDLEIFFTRRE